MGHRTGSLLSGVAIHSRPAKPARRAALVVLAPLSGEADGVVRCSDRIEHVAGGVRAIGAR